MQTSINNLSYKTNFLQNSKDDEKKKILKIQEVSQFLIFYSSAIVEQKISEALSDLQVASFNLQTLKFKYVPPKIVKAWWDCFNVKYNNYSKNNFSQLNNAPQLAAHKTQQVYLKSIFTAFQEKYLNIQNAAESSENQLPDLKLSAKWEEKYVEWEKRFNNWKELLEVKKVIEKQTFSLLQAVEEANTTLPSSLTKLQLKGHISHNLSALLKLSYTQLDDNNINEAKDKILSILTEYRTSAEPLHSLACLNNNTKHFLENSKQYFLLMCIDKIYAFNYLLQKKQNQNTSLFNKLTSDPLKSKEALLLILGALITCLLLFRTELPPIQILCIGGILVGVFAACIQILTLIENRRENILRTKDLLPELQCLMSEVEKSINNIGIEEEGQTYNEKDDISKMQLDGNINIEDVNVRVNNNVITPTSSK